MCGVLKPRGKKKKCLGGEGAREEFKTFIAKRDDATDFIIL